MSNQTWVETLVTSQVDGPSLASFTTAVTMLPTSAIYTIPANYFYIGRMLRVRAYGRIGATATPNYIFDFRLGTLATPIITFTSGAVTCIAGTTQTFELEINLTCRAIGSGTSANLMGQGHISSALLTGSTTNAQATTFMMPFSSGAVGTGFDSTIANVANLFVTSSASSPSNTVICHQYSLESMN